jgi:alpha-glucosidase
MPVVWDDTKYIAGYPGKDAVIARRKGNRWYIAGINGEAFEKELTIDLSITGEPPANVELISDGGSARELQYNSMVPNNGKLTIHMKPLGGFAGYWD